jgi:site-specific DNA recombinase
VIPAVAYARFSSDMQREESVEAQLKHINEYAQKNNMVIIKEYVDRGISGKYAKERDSFMQMILDSKQRNFQYVLIHKSNRFARNREESALYKHRLKRQGVKVIATAQDFGEGPHAVIMEALMEGLDEFYSLELANETMKGLMVNASKCQYNGGHVLFGYRVNDKKLYEIEPSEASVVKDIFNKIANGWSYVEVLRHLDKTGKRTRRGNKFGKNSLHDMLRNERYTGVYIFNETSRRDKFTGKRINRVKKPKEEMIRINGGMPQIVPTIIWKKVQEIMDKRKCRTRSAKRGFLLTGFIECGLCGSAYVGSTSTTKYTQKGYYICTRKKTKADCKNQNISQEMIEEKVIETIKSIINSIDASILAKAMNKVYAELSKDAIHEKKQLEKEIAILDKKINNLLDIIEEGTATETIKNRLNENATEKSALELRLNNLSIGVPVFTENIIKQQIKLLHPNNKTAEEQRTVFRKLGLKIRVYPDNHDHPIKITYGEKIVCLKNVSSPRYHPLSKLFIKIFLSDLNL